MSIAPLGARVKWKNTCAPHTNMTIVMPSGMKVQSSSSASEPWMTSPTSSSCRRWNLVAKTTTRIAIRSAKQPVTATRKKYRASTCGLLGRLLRKERKVREHSVSCGRVCARLACFASLTAQADKQERQESGDRRDEPGPDGVEDRHAVLPDARVVVVAEQQHLVRHRAELVVRRFDERQAEIARREVNPEEIPGHDPLRRRHVDRRPVRVLLDVGVVGVAEPDGLRQRRDRRLGAGEEVPAAGGLRPAVLRDVGLLLVRGEAEVVLRVDAHDHDVEVLARVERQRLQRPRQAVQDLRAEHRALVIREGEHHGARAEELAELHVAAVLVPERQVERQLLPDFLVDADLAEHARLRRHRLGSLRAFRVLRRCARRDE